MSRSTQKQPREPIRDINYVFTFGRWKGVGLQEVYSDAPDYIAWLIENTDFEIHADLLDKLTENSPTYSYIPKS